MAGKDMYHVGGYVKLAKLWERSAASAINYHNNYYSEKYAEDPHMELYSVYVDITGQKEIRKRQQMIRLISDCVSGHVDCIATQTRAYLAANNRELFYLIRFLFDLPGGIEIVTEDEQYHIDTIKNADSQKQALSAMASDYIKMNPTDYEDWKKGILIEVRKINSR